MNKIDISGFIITDNLANQMGVYGEAGDDWKLLEWSQFNNTEKSFLNFSDNIDMSNTAVSTVTVYPAYPNPCTTTGQFGFTVSDSVKFKIAVVDSDGDVLFTFAWKTKGSQFMALNFSDTNTFPLGKSLRYYFSFSAASQANFKVGYGDVKKCRQTNFTTYSECF